MSEMTERTVALGDVELHLHEAGDGPPVVLAHGFPELGYSWRHQIPALASAGYHVLAPDQRGYGRSTRPDAVESYDIVRLTGDLVALLDSIGEEKAVFVGHDWGSNVVWALSQLHPDRVAGVVGMSVPFLPRPAMPPIEMLRSIMGDQFFYILYFQEPGVADAELGGDPGRTMRRMLCGATMREDQPIDVADMFAADDRGFIDRMPEPAALPGWLSEEELDHYVAEFSRTGFTGGINWYRNMDRNWHLTEALADAHVSVPSLFIGGALDPVLVMTPPGMAADRLDDHRGDLIVEGAGHWVQQEKPDEVNDALLRFLGDVLPV